MKTQNFRFLLWLFLLLVNAVCFAQRASFRVFSVDDGLAQSQVYTMLQDHKGYLWIGTRGGGLSRFDGKYFNTYSEQQGLASNYISCLHQAKDKRLWIGTTNGLNVYNGKRIKKIPSNEFKNLSVNTIVEEKENLWFGSNYGLFRLESGKLKQVYIANFPQNTSIYALKFVGRKLYIGTGIGLYTYDLKTKKLFSFGDKHKVMKNAITCIQKDSNGRLLIGTFGDGMYCYDFKQFYRLDLHLELYKETVFNFLVTKNEIWIATLTQGLVHYDKKSKQFQSYNQTDGLGNNHVRTIIRDNSGDLWLGSSGGGICQMSKKLFAHYTTRSGLGANFVYSICRDSGGKLWLGTGQNGVSTLDNGVFSQHNKDNGFGAVKVKGIVEAGVGKMYFGTEGQGIGVLENGNFSWMKGTKRFYIKQILKDRSGTIWVATVGNGLLKINPKTDQVEQLTVRKGCIENRLTSLAEDKLGRIWYGTESRGVGCYDPQTKKNSGVNSSQKLVNDATRCLAIDNTGNIWVGTAGFGISAVDPNSFKVLKTVTVKNGLHSSNIYSLVFDSKNRLLVGTESGLNQLTFDKKLGLIKSVNYGRGDGFLGVEACQNSIWKDKDGRIWIGTINGATVYSPNNIQENKVPPSLGFVDIQLFYNSLKKTRYSDLVLPWHEFSDLKLPYDQNHLSFIFKGINLRNPDAVQYSWKMDGFDENWSPWTTEKRITYSNLPSGKFTFLVRSKNEDGVYSEHPLRIDVSIATPFWRTIWFIILVGLIGIVILYGAFRYQSKRIQQEAVKAQEKAEMEKNLLDLEQKALRLQMNPHFIFNALNSIQALIGTENETKARYYLAKFARLMRQILDNSRKTTITLEEEIATLENYLLVEQFCNGNRFDYEIISDLLTEANYVEIPPMLVQPFVENAIKHGFRYAAEKEQRGKLIIRFTEKANGLSCSIIDNGIGRQASSDQKTFADGAQHDSKGLAVTEERLQLLGEGQQVEINDLYDSEGNGVGTQVNLLITFKHG